MDKWGALQLRHCAASPTPAVSALMGGLDLPASPEVAGLVEDGATTLAAAIALDQPLIAADYFSFVSSRLDVLTQGRVDLRAALSRARDAVRDLQADDGPATMAFLDRAMALTSWAPPSIPTRTDFGALAADYLSLLLRERHDEARALVRGALRDGATIREILIPVLEAAQREIGRRWQVGEVTVAQEHYCTAVTQVVLSDLYPTLFTGGRPGRQLVAVDAPGSLHQVGLRMVVDLLEYEGWNTYHAGSVGPGGIVDLLRSQDAVVLAIAASMPHQLTDVAATIAAVRSDPRTHHVKILVGGRPFTVAPDLAASVGADGWARNAADAVTACDRLVPVHS